MKFKDFLVNASDFEGRGWAFQGVCWGLSMFVIMGLIVPMITVGELSWRDVGNSAIIWSIGGVCYSYFMRWAMKRNS